MKEIIILGCGPTRVDCPYERDAEVWGVNAGWHFAHRLDRLFVFDDFGKGEFQFDEVIDAVRKGGYPIISKAPYQDLPIQIFPLQEIAQRFRTTYFTNTICYMISMALYEGVDKLSIYGVDHLIHQGYVMEKAGVEHWVGIALGLGVEVEIAEGSALCKTADGKCYGYDFYYTDPDFRIPEDIIVARPS